LNTAIDLSFVAKYQYPTLVKEHFERILSHIDASKVESVILTGSTSRGELSYQMTRGALSLYSDYEFMIIAKKSVDKNDEVRLSKCFEGLECNLSNNHLFHIDFSYINTRQLRNIPFHLKHYETKENGITIYGRDLLHLMPNTTLKNLDFKDLNEILIWRLWAILLYLPNEFVRCGRVNSAKENMYKYVLCRNLLDLTTWILPLKGVLLPSFRQRHTYLKSNFSKLQDGQVINSKFLDLLNEGMIGKFELRFSRSLVDFYVTVIEYFMRAKQHLLDIYHITDDNNTANSFSLEKNSRNLFHDYHYKRKAYETLFFLKNYRDVGIRRGIRWILTGKYGLMLEFLCNIHLALVLQVSDNRRHGSAHLDAARCILQRLSVLNTLKIDSKEFSELLFILRRGFANFLMDYFRSLKMKKDYINSVIE
jgi:hypothetical protein